jgi:hypothetical protein
MPTDLTFLRSTTLIGRLLGRANDEFWVTGPWLERLVLGGSQTSATNPSYLAGAIEAARCAVAETLERLGTSRELAQD